MADEKETVDVEDVEVTEEDNETVDSNDEETSKEATVEEQIDDAELKILEAKIAGQESKMNELKENLESRAEDQEKVERLTAEFNNFKTRTMNDRAKAKTNGKIKVINEILDPLDNLERAMAFQSDTEDFKVGLVMINNMLKEKLSNLGYESEASNDK